MAGRTYGVPMHTENAYYISKLKWARENKGMSQAKLADISGVRLRQIQAYESNERPINAAAALTVYKLATALGCRIEELLNL